MTDNREPRKPTLLSRDLVEIEAGELEALRITVAEDQEVIESYEQHAEAAEAALREAIELLEEAKSYCIPFTGTYEDIEAFIETHKPEGSQE
jgi:hypothetical protein